MPVFIVVQNRPGKYTDFVVPVKFDSKIDFWRHLAQHHNESILEDSAAGIFFGNMLIPLVNYTKTTKFGNNGRVTLLRDEFTTTRLLVLTPEEYYEFRQESVDISKD